MKMRLAAFLLIGVGLGLGASRPAEAQFEELARRVPSTANTLVLIDAEKVYTSAAAERDDWKVNRQKAWEAGLSLLPPTAKHAVLGSQLDLTSMATLWEVAVMRLEHEPSLDKLAKLSGGTTDSVGPYAAVQMSGDSFVVDFKNRVIGAITPGNRQFVGRWIRETDGRKVDALAPYLSEALRFAEQGAPIIIALDLEDFASVDEVRAGLDALPESVGLKGINLAQLAESLSSIRGITLGITLRDKPFGKIKVDFAKEIPLPAESAKRLLLHALARRGGMIDEFEDWTSGKSGKQVTLEGELTQVGMRRLSSLFHRPPAIPHPELAIKPAPGQSPGDQQSVVVSTKNYFDAMSKLLDDLNDRKSSSGTKTMGQVGVFCERYAAKIEKLPTLNVDPYLLDKATEVCSTLRRIHSTIAQGAYSGNTAARNVTMSFNHFGYGETYGFVYGQPVGSFGVASVPDLRTYNNQQSNARYQANTGATLDARSMGAQIRASMAETRRQLTEKYKTQF